MLASPSPEPPLRISPLSALAAAAFIGCRPGATLDTGLVPADGCELDPEHFQDVSIEPAPVPTVFYASWSTADPTVGHVVFSAGDEPWETAPSQQASTTHQALLVGSPADAEVRIRLVSAQDGVQRCSATVVMTTPSPPPELPVMSVDPDYRSVEPDGWALVPFGPSETSIPTLVDSQGRYCWWLEEGGYFFYAKPGHDGRTLLLLDSADGELEDGRLLEVGLDGQTIWERNVPSGHNDYTLLPDGSILVLGREVYDGTVDGRTLQMTSDTLIALQPDGGHAVVWTARETLWLALQETIEIIAATHHDDGPVDWTHGTGLFYDAETDRVLLSLTYAGVIVALERSTLETAWILGGDGGTLTPHEERGGTVSVPHSIQALDQRVLIYNQRMEREEQICGEATEVLLDLDAGTAETSWVGRAPDCGYPDIMGSAHRSFDGTTIVAGGTLGQLSWFDQHGELVWRLNGELGAAVGGAVQVPAFH